MLTMITVVRWNCAQRLSASQRWASGPPPQPVFDPAVLNAFRHHRGGHQQMLADLGPALLCSTPFGITEVGIRKTSPNHLTPNVLNAFRHHRGGHQDGDGNPSTTIECSTPFGITEVGIPMPGRSGRRGRMCSTPFGITEVGIAVTAIDSLDPSWCSTPFGITEVGMWGHRFDRSSTLGAQRLSASQRW